jgi:undecaprenyl-diphosphatase
MPPVPVPPLYAHDPFLLVQHALGRPWLDPVMAALTIACEGWAMVLVGAAFIGWRERRLREWVRPFLTACLALLLAGAVVHWLKPVLDTPRPLAVYGPALVHVQLEPLFSGGFPSGHSASVAALAFFALARYGRRAWPLLVLAFLGGLSRVYVGAHWVLDVLGGWTVGALCGTVAAPTVDGVLRGVRTVRARRGDGGSAPGGGRKVEALGQPEVVGLDPKAQPVDGKRP